MQAKFAARKPAMPAVVRSPSVRPPKSLPPAEPPPEPAAARPFLKWAGGKQGLKASFASLYPVLAPGAAYHEPFLGGGTVFFDVKQRLRPKRCSLADNNSDLMAAWAAVRDDVDAVIAALERHRARHNEKHFYATRSIGPTELATMSPIERGARLMYLNKTCFNGLYRVNSKGLFNVPMGRYKNPGILDVENLRNVSAALRWVRLTTAPFPSILERAQRGDFVYFDPPYVPLSLTSSFTAYTMGSFGEDDQRTLAEVYRELDRRGCQVMLSNSDAPLVRELYKGFKVKKVQARRSINSKSDRRGHITELVVLNY
jgi:DNA adenine methylase